jgi:PBP1b-binding outer membrane lipoprotein LpoB
MSNLKFSNKMKKVLLFLAVAGLFAACTPKATETPTESANEENVETVETPTETPAETPAI